MAWWESAPVTKLGQFLRQPQAQRALFMEACLCLFVARLLLLVPFRWVAPHLGVHMTESPESIAPEALPQVRRVAKTIRWASRHMPWQCKCLVRAMAAKAMLRRRGFASTLYMGVAKDPGPKQLKAHAWLRCGPIVLTGGAEAPGFAVVSTFAEKDS
ncbi:MAG: lasso peptide biosynthesis B2 protein [Candidatus Hydrogenedentes bacterium]|nr:lasso peptide biosynthesis B2 protein [Candidatus Hydrogenedentota bacterium]